MQTNFLLLSLLLLAAVTATVSGLVKQNRTTTIDVLPHNFKGRIAFDCHSHHRVKGALIWTPAGWRLNARIRKCVKSPDEILKICRGLYPTLHVTNVRPASKAERINGRNYMPWSCLSGKYQSPSLLVSPHCQFQHVSNMNRRNQTGKKCHQHSHWGKVARLHCLTMRQRNSTHVGLHLSSMALLSPCDHLPHAGFFAGVEFVCCPKHIHSRISGSTRNKSNKNKSKNKNKNKNNIKDSLDLQSYLAVAKLPHNREHSRFLAARRSLQHHQLRRENRIVGQLRLAEEKVASLSRRDPDSAARLLAEIEKRFSRSFLATQQEEKAEKDQLNMVHQRRVIVSRIRKLHHLQLKLHLAVVARDAHKCRHLLHRLIELVAKEATRVAKRAKRLQSRRKLSTNHLRSLRQHASALITGLRNATDDGQLRKILGINTIKAIVSRNSAAVANANAELLSIKVSAATAAAYPPSLAERFDHLIKLYHQESNRIIANARRKHKLQLANHHGNYQRHAAVKFGKSSSSTRALPSILIGLLCALATVFLLAAVAALLLKLIVKSKASPVAKVNKSLATKKRNGGFTGVASDDTDALSQSGCVAADKDAYPTIQPKPLHLPDSNLASMQANGYVNPTYQFYEE